MNVIPPTHSAASRSLVRGWGVFCSKFWGWCSHKLWTTEFWSARFRLNFTPQDFFWSENSVKNYQSSYPVGLSDITRCSLSDLTQLLLETKTAWHLQTHFDVWDCWTYLVMNTKPPSIPWSNLSLICVFTQVLQKLGKTMETKDEQFELCSQSLNKQQVEQQKIISSRLSLCKSLRMRVLSCLFLP